MIFDLRTSGDFGFSIRRVQHATAAGDLRTVVFAEPTEAKVSRFCITMKFALSISHTISPPILVIYLKSECSLKWHMLAISTFRKYMLYPTTTLRLSLNEGMVDDITCVKPRMNGRNIPVLYWRAAMEREPTVMMSERQNCLSLSKHTIILPCRSAHPDRTTWRGCCPATSSSRYGRLRWLLIDCSV